MLYVYLASGEQETIPRARTCRVGNRHVLFLDRAGHVVRRLPVANVLAYAATPMYMADDRAARRKRRLGIAARPAV
jgi:hypothetical protein